MARDVTKTVSRYQAMSVKRSPPISGRGVRTASCTGREVVPLRVEV
jgi:hypothetical protein